MLRRFFDPNDLRPAVVNWEEVAGDLLRHLHDEVAAAPTDAAARRLLDELVGYPAVPTRWRIREVEAPPPEQPAGWRSLASRFLVCLL